MSGFSDYIIYVHQYDDDENWKVLQFCIFDKRHYSEVVVPKIQQYKFKHFGHDGLVFGMGKARGINQKKQRLDDINVVVEQSNFVLIACLINLKQLEAENIADTQVQALEFGLVHAHRFLQERGQTDALTYVVSNSADVEQKTFRAICEQNQDLPFELQVSDPHTKPLALQFASALVPSIIEQFQNPEAENSTFNILKNKFYCKGGRKQVGQGFEGWGLRQFPD